MLSSRSRARGRVPAVLSLLVAVALAATPLASYADEPTAAPEPTATVEPTATSEPTAGAGPTAEPTAFTVTFPARRTLDPRTTTYDIDVTAPADAQVSWSWQGRAQLLQGPGRHTLSLTAGDGTVSVRMCPAVGYCQSVESPSLLARTEISAAVPPTVLSPQRHQGAIGFWSGMVPAGQQVDLDWTLTDPSGQVVGSGRGSSTVDETHTVLVPLLEDDELLSTGTTYTWRVALAADLPGFGPLQGTAEATVTWDDSTTAEMRLTGARVFPERDGYLDNIAAKLEGPLDLWRIQWQVVDATGAVVRSTGFEYARRSDFWFGWRDEAQQELPAGTYRFRALVEDRAHNTAVIDSPEITMSRAELGWETWTKEVPVARTVVDRTVGSCSTLVSPAPGRGRGSLGYRSQSRCARPADGEVITVHRQQLPPAFQDQYRSLSVDLTGGRAAGASNAYLVTYLLREDEVWKERDVLRSTWRRWPGAEVNMGYIHGRRSAAPYVSWFQGLSEGSRFDVTTATVSVKRQVLR